MHLKLGVLKGSNTHDPNLLVCHSCGWSKSLWSFSAGAGTPMTKGFEHSWRSFFFCTFILGWWQPFGLWKGCQKANSIKPSTSSIRIRCWGTTLPPTSLACQEIPVKLGGMPTCTKWGRWENLERSVFSWIICSRLPFCHHRPWTTWYSSEYLLRFLDWKFLSLHN